MNWSAISALVPAYDIFDDVREAARVVDTFIEGLTGKPLMEKVIFGWEDDDEDEVE